MATDYASLKVTQLKDILKERGISAAGLTRKQQIIEVLESNDAGEDTNDVDQNDAVDVLPGGQDPAEEAVTSEPMVEDTQDEKDTGVDSIQGETEASLAAADSRKRKRRSPTPTPSQHDINKKLAYSNEVTTTNQPHEFAPRSEGTEEDAGQETNNHRNGDLHKDGNRNGLQKSIHPVSRAIYIKGLVRPLQATTLRDHVEQLSRPSNDTMRSSTIDLFHLDALKTHAFALFATVDCATRVRAAMHGSVWPDESVRKPLWVDYVPDEKVQSWIEMENEQPDSRRGMIRWEVKYDVMADDQVSVTLVDTSKDSLDAAQRQTANADQGVRSAPSDSRADRAVPAEREEREASRDVDMDEQADAVEDSEQTFDGLDGRFSSTTAKPKIYFLPQPRDMVERRLRELDGRTSRDWDGGRQTVGGPGDQLRRYTFDDGDVLVDGGPDFGSFGVPKSAQRGNNYGGGDGYRGHRGGRR